MVYAKYGIQFSLTAPLMLHEVMFCNLSRNYWIAVGNVGIFCLIMLIILNWTGENLPRTREKYQPIAKVTGLILARCGSKGIKKKNLSLLNGKSLLQISLQVMFDFGKFDKIWVSTDCKEMADNAKELFPAVNIHWRAPYTATDEASSITAIQEFCHKHHGIEAVGLVQCTSPFIQAVWLNKAFELMTSQEYDSVFSAVRKHKLLWESTDDGSMKPINFNPNHRPRRQDWNGFLIENGMFYFTRVELIEKNLIQGGRIGVIEVPENHSLEIDTEFDLKLARNIIQILKNDNIQN